MESRLPVLQLGRMSDTLLNAPSLITSQPTHPYHIATNSPLSHRNLSHRNQLTAIRSAATPSALLSLLLPSCDFYHWFYDVFPLEDMLHILADGEESLLYPLSTARTHFVKRHWSGRGGVLVRHCYSLLP